MGWYEKDGNLNDPKSHILTNMSRMMDPIQVNGHPFSSLASPEWLENESVDNNG
jgi:hypothetical protein